MSDDQRNLSALPLTTTSAIGQDGRTVWFEDAVRDGEYVWVGGFRKVVRFHADAPDWFVEDK